MTADILIAIISSGALVTILNFTFTLLKDWYDRKNGLRAGMRILLDDRLTWLGAKYIKDGEISAENLKIYEKMHKAYKSLGGSGYHDTLMKRIDSLPIKFESKEK